MVRRYSFGEKGRRSLRYLVPVNRNEWRVVLARRDKIQAYSKHDVIVIVTVCSRLVAKKNKK